MLKLAVIGFGGRTDSVFNEIFKYVRGNVELTGVIDPAEEAVRERLKKYGLTTTFFTDIPEMISKSKPDGIIVGTRCKLHTPIALELSKYDIPIFLEKPVSVNMEQALELEAAYENSKTKVVVSFPLRVSPICTYVREKINCGAIGKPNDILGLNYVPYGRCYFEEHYRDYEAAQGLILQKATHDLDYIMYLMGSPIKNIIATASFNNIFGGNKPAGLTCGKCDEKYTCKESNLSREKLLLKRDTPSHLCPFSIDCGTPESGMNEDSSSMLLAFENGARGVYTQVFYITDGAEKRGANINGYDGTLEFDWYTGNVRYHEHHRNISSDIKVSSGESHFAGDFALANNFIDVILHNAESLSPISAGLQSAYACLAAKESLVTKRFTAVRKVGETVI